MCLFWVEGIRASTQITILPSSQGRSGEVSWFTTHNGRMIMNLTSALMTNWDFFPPFFPLKILLAKQNLRSWSLDKNPPSPPMAAFSEYSIFLLYWHLPLDLIAVEWQVVKHEFVYGNLTCLVSFHPKSGRLGIRAFMSQMRDLKPRRCYELYRILWCWLKNQLHSRAAWTWSCSPL